MFLYEGIDVVCETMTQYDRRQFIRSVGVGGAVGLSSLSGCTGSIGGGGTPTLNFHYVVPVENAASLLAVPEIQDAAADNLGDAYEFKVTHDSSTPDSVNSMATGKADIIMTTTVSFASAVNENAVPDGISAIGVDFWDAHPDRYSIAIFTGPDSDITDIKDLKGAKLGVNALGTGIHAAYVKGLQSAGLSRDDVKFVETPFPTFVPSIKDGTIDAGVFPALFAVNARKENFTKVYETADVWDSPYPFAYPTASKKTLENKSDAVRAWAEDYASLFEYSRNNRGDVVSAAAKHFELPEALLDAYYFTDKDYHRKIRIQTNQLQTAMDEMQSLGFLKSSIDVKNHATNEYLP